MQKEKQAIKLWSGPLAIMPGDDVAARHHAWLMMRQWDIVPGRWCVSGHDEKMYREGKQENKPYSLLDPTR
jgi:hypothetical protein